MGRCRDNFQVLRIRVWFLSPWHFSTGQRKKQLLTRHRGFFYRMRLLRLARGMLLLPAGATQSNKGMPGWALALHLATCYARPCRIPRCHALFSFFDMDMFIGKRFHAVTRDIGLARLPPPQGSAAVHWTKKSKSSKPFSNSEAAAPPL